jgi:hypothetical protein
VTLLSFIQVVRTIILGLHAILLIPVIIIAFVAYADYQVQGCAGKSGVEFDAIGQCGDAWQTIKVAVAYVLAAPAMWIGFRVLERAVKNKSGSPHA